MFKFIVRLTKKKVGIVLKSGKEIVIYCDKFNWTYVGDEIKSYKIEGMVTPMMSYVTISEIASIVTYRDEFFSFKSKA